MIETKTYQPPITFLMPHRSDNSLEISRLLAAAVVNQQFCRLLLDDPELALETGLHGETFSLTNEERNLILSIRADSLADLAGQLARTFDEHIHMRVNRPIQPVGCFGY